MFSFILGTFASGPIFRKKIIPLAYTNYLCVMPKGVSSARKVQLVEALSLTERLRLSSHCQQSPLAYPC